MGEAAKINSAQEAKYIKMTTEPVDKLVREFALPSIGSLLITNIYNLVATFFVSHINTQSTAAIGVVFSYMALVQAGAFFFGQGSANFISRALGKKDLGSAETMAATGLLTAMAMAVFFTAIGFIFMEPILRIMGSTATIMPYAKSYMRFILIGAPFIAGGFVLNNQMRLQGNAMLALIGIGSGTILNIFLTPALIFWADMGVAGAGLSTLVCQMLSFFLMLRISGRRGGVRIVFSRFKLNWGILEEITSGGLPSLTRQGLAAVAGVCLNYLASGYGDSAVAAFSIVNRVMMFALAAMLGYGQGFQPVCGFNYGAGLFDRVRKGFWRSTKVSSLYCLAFSVAGFIFAPQIIASFRKDDAEVMRLGIEILRWQCLSFPFVAFITMSNMYLQNIRKTVPAVIVAMSRQGLFFLPILFASSGLLDFKGLEMTQPLADWLSFIVSVPLTLTALKNMEKDKPAANFDEQAEF